MPINQVAKKYDVKSTSLYRHKQRHMSSKVSKALERKDLASGEDLLNMLTTYIDNINKLSEACLKELEDPENPDKLFVGAKAEEITVLYTTKHPQTGRKTKAKALLQDLLDLIDADGNTAYKVSVNTEDRARTLLQASQTLNKHLHLFAELRGLVGATTINITAQPVFIEFTQTVIKALNDYPEARSTVAEHLRTLKIEPPKPKDAV